MAQAVVDVDEVGEPGGGGPCLLRVPGPIGAPRLLGPQRAEEHADGQKRPADVDKIVAYGHSLTVDICLVCGAAGGSGAGGRLIPRKAISDRSGIDCCTPSPPSAMPQEEDGHDKGGSEQSVGHHVDDDMRGKPRTLERRHQGLVVDLGPEHIDDDEHGGEDGGEGEDPSVSPAAVDEKPRHGQEEAVPQACLAHRAQRRALERYPQPYDERHEHGQSRYGRPAGQTATAPPRSP